ncbi:MAG: serine/threonine protein kinase [Verrucomicrobia bacterium]|jgi:serine/threonine protein kinase|nr:serine/threonine protein kinase [Verrucomicrobiota bacterium]
MDKSTTNVQDVFAEAMGLPRGEARVRFLAARCGSDPALRDEVESLLRAHDDAGEFLNPPPPVPGAQVGVHASACPPRTPDKLKLELQRGRTSDALGTAVMNAAAHAEAFLRGVSNPTDEQVENFVAQVPEVLRPEARERIQAGLHVRQLRDRERRPPSEHEEELPRLPGYHIERKLGYGGLGVVYAAHDEKLNRRVAIKVLRRRSDAQVRKRVLAEARHTASLGDPGVVTIFSVLDETDPPAIVMEFVEGFPIDRFAVQLNFEQKARLLREVARGLSAAHAAGLIHRDLKPDNIIVGPDMRPRILDFGLALSLEEAGRQGRWFEGTPLYASPEQALDKPLAAASDVFSFGSLMFKVLTGKAPFAGDSISQVLEAIASTAPPFLREVAVGVPEDLQAVCLACLAWNPADRPTAEQIALELGRFLVGEPVRLKPKLYDDLLRRSISEHENQARAWESQSIISREERDALEVMHRRLLADEDHWIIDARRITPLQTILSGATWLTVVATVLMVWLLRDEFGPPWRWLLPAFFTMTLLLAGRAARREREPLAAATFLAGATLAIAPCALALLAEFGAFATAPTDVKQLFAGTFTNQQVLASSLAALAVSMFGLWRLKMTGFAWTTAMLATTSYLSLLLLFNWLEKEPEIQALWCLPVMAMELVALRFERSGRVRWTTPFHLVALITLVAGLDVIAMNGPTLDMLGVDAARWPYFDHERQVALSVVMNGLLFLALMLTTERSASLDLRRASKLLEVLAILHVLSALFVNAMNHRDDAHVRVDVWLYLSAAVLLAVLAPFRSRWRLLVGGLAGCGLGSYLLVNLGLVARKPFIVGLGFAGLLVALGTFVYVRRKSRPGN